MKLKKDQTNLLNHVVEDIQNKFQVLTENVERAASEALRTAQTKKTNVSRLENKINYLEKIQEYEEATEESRKRQRLCPDTQASEYNQQTANQIEINTQAAQDLIGSDLFP